MERYPNPLKQVESVTSYSKNWAPVELIAFKGVPQWRQVTYGDPAIHQMPRWTKATAFALTLMGSLARRVHSSARRPMEVLRQVLRQVLRHLSRIDLSKLGKPVVGPQLYRNSSWFAVAWRLFLESLAPGWHTEARWETAPSLISLIWLKFMILDLWINTSSVIYRLYRSI